MVEKHTIWVYKRNRMKKLILSLVVAAFAVSVQAADDSSSGSCCAAKNASTKQAKNTCTKCEKGMKQASVKQLKSPKATG